MKTLKHIIFTDIEINNYDNYLIFNEGGIGKTTQMKEAYLELVNSHINKTVPLFIDCKSLNFKSDFPILSAILEKYCGKNCMESTHLELLKKLICSETLSHDSYKFIIFIDGINECESNKYTVLQDIDKLLKSPHNKIIVSSRINEDEFACRGFKKLKVKEFNDEQIIAYLNSKGINDNGNSIELNRLNNSLLKMLRIPMFLKLFASTYSDKRIFPDVYTTNIVRKADLLQGFLDKILVDKSNQHSNKIAPEYLEREFALERYLPALAYEMSLLHSYSIHNDVLKNLRTTVFNTNYFERFESEDETIFESISLKRIVNICIEEFSLLKKSNDHYAFYHQVWHDFFCAKFYVMCMKYNIIDVFNNSISVSIRQFIGEIVKNENGECECDFEKAIDLEETKNSPINVFLQNNYRMLNKKTVAISNLVNIMKTCRNNNITSKFDNLDLKSVDFIDCNIQNSSFTNSFLYDSNFQLPGHCGYIYSCLITSDNRFVFSAGRDKTIRKWSLKSITPTSTSFLNHKDGVCSLALSPNEKLLISGSADCTIRLWDLELNSQIGDPFIGHTSVVSCLTISNDSTNIFSGSYDGSIRKWKIDPIEKKSKTIFSHNSYVNKIALTSNNRYLIASYEDGNILICNFKNNTKEIIKNKTPIRSLCVSNSNNLVYFGDFEGNIKYFNLKTNTKLVNLFGKSSSAIESLDISPDDNYLISGERAGTIKLWKRNNSLSGNLIQSIVGHTDWINCVNISKDGKFVVSAGGDQTIKVWMFLDRLYEYDKLRGYNDWIRKVVITESEKIICAGDDKKIRIWDATKKMQISNPLKGHAARINALAVSHNEDYIISGGDDGAIIIWNKDEKANYNSFTIQQDFWIRSIAISQTNDFFVTGSWDNSIKVWDLNEKKQIFKNPMKHEGSVEGLAITSDDKFLVSCSDDKTIKIWDLKKQTQIGKTIYAHNGFIRSIILSKDEKNIISGSYDNDIKLWSFNECCQIGKTLAGHKNRINGMINFKENILISCSDDGSVKFWDINSQEEFETETIYTDTLISDIAINNHNNDIIGVGYNNQIHFWNKNSNCVIHNIYTTLNCDVTNADIKHLNKLSPLSKELVDILYRNGACV